MGYSRWRRELDRDPARRITPRRRAIGGLLVLATVMAACADSSGTSGHRGVPSSAYWGGHPPDPHVTIPDLPAAAPTPAGSLDDAAAALAARVEAGDDSSLPAILTALNLAGIAVRNNDGAIMRPAAAPGSGISIDRWEVVALGMFARSRAAVSQDDLTNSLASQVPALAGTPLGAWILDGLRTNAQSSRPQAPFLARLVIELARQNPYAPTDILAATPPTDVVLDGVAMELVLRRLAADILAFATTIHASPVPFAAPASPSAADMHVNGAGQIQLAEAAGPAAPCTMEESASKILDANAIAFTTAFDKLTERLVEWTHGSTAIQGLKNFGAVANIVLALAKLLAYYSALDVKVEMQSAPPLTRTKSTTAGEKKTLIATARLAPAKNLQMINCIRIVLNFLGMDVSMPQSGAIADSEANWVLVKGGAARAEAQPVRSCGSPVPTPATPVVATPPISAPPRTARPRSASRGLLSADRFLLRPPRSTRMPRSGWRFSPSHPTSPRTSSTPSWGSHPASG